MIRLHSSKKRILNRCGTRGDLEMRMLILAGCVLLSACGGNHASIYRSANFASIDDSHDGKVFSVDAQQRFLIASEIQTFICAEPSPDAIQAVSASLAAGVEIPDKVAAELATSIASQVGSIGLRTQSIQLLRDAMYRACEAHLSGAITGQQLMILQQRYQNIMIGLLAIEQLTGAIRAPAVVLTSAAAADTGDKLLKAQENLDKAALAENEKKAAFEVATSERDSSKKAADTKTKEAEDAKKVGAANADNLAEEAKRLQDVAAEAENKRTKANEELQSATKNRETMEKLVAAARSVNTEGSGSGSIEEISQAQQLSDNQIKEVSQTVKQIVTDIVNKDPTIESCVSFLASATPISRSVIGQEYEDLLERRRFITGFCIDVLANPNVKIQLQRQLSPSG